MIEKFYRKGTNVYCENKIVQEMQSVEYAERLAKHLNEIHRGFLND